MTNSACHRPRRGTPTCRTTTLVPFLLISTIIIAFWMIMAESPPPPLPLGATHLVYTTVPGFFAQSLPSTDDKTFDFTKSNFGLISQSYDTDTDLPSDASLWERFAQKLASLNAHAPETVSYRVLFLGRHGQGYHNVAERHFGTKAWDCYYSTLNGTANMTWADAHLTPVGERQAENAAQFWRAQIANEGMPRPRSWYVSPLDRALRTAGIAFGDGEGRVVVKEMLREGIGVHTCDRRSSLTYIKATYPSYAVEPCFAEADPLWLPELREPGVAQTLRLRGLLDDVFGSDEATWISMMSHGGTIQSILRAVGHRAFNVETGGVVPVLVKMERRDGYRSEEEDVPWERKPECEGGEPGMEEVTENLAALEEVTKL